jgi:hypothetical protein
VSLGGKTIVWLVLVDTACLLLAAWLITQGVVKAVPSLLILSPCLLVTNVLVIRRASTGATTARGPVLFWAWLFAALYSAGAVLAVARFVKAPTTLSGVQTLIALGLAALFVRILFKARVLRAPSAR